VQQAETFYCLFDAHLLLHLQKGPERNLMMIPIFNWQLSGDLRLWVAAISCRTDATDTTTTCSFIQRLVCGFFIWLSCETYIVICYLQFSYYLSSVVMSDFVIRTT
jgi:hypothetical protein